MNIPDECLVIDASKMGNISRFITRNSESTACNCEAKVLLNRDLPRIGIYALADIQLGEELVCKV